MFLLWEDLVVDMCGFLKVKSKSMVPCPPQHRASVCFCTGSVSTKGGNLGPLLVTPAKTGGVSPFLS